MGAIKIKSARLKNLKDLEGKNAVVIAALEKFIIKPIVKAKVKK